MWFLRALFVVSLALQGASQTREPGIPLTVYKGSEPFQGPEECGQLLDKYYEIMSEFTNDTNTTVNFLSMSEPCNYQAEKDFMKEMKETYMSARETEVGTGVRRTMVALRKVWNKWRSNTVSGSTEGNRICNPRRLLSCHESLSQCVCRKWAILTLT